VRLLPRSRKIAIGAPLAMLLNRPADSVTSVTSSSPETMAGTAKAPSMKMRVSTSRPSLAK
jgi:hypothetical protein